MSHASKLSVLTRKGKKWRKTAVFGDNSSFIAVSSQFSIISLESYRHVKFQCFFSWVPLTFSFVPNFLKVSHPPPPLIPVVVARAFFPSELTNWFLSYNFSIIKLPTPLNFASGVYITHFCMPLKSMLIIEKVHFFIPEIFIDYSFRFHF